MILSLPHSLGGEIRLAGNPIKTPAIDESGHAAPPTMGQHNTEVLSGILGYSEEKIRRLREEEEEHREEMERRVRKTSIDPAARRLQEQAAREEEGNQDE